MMVIKTAKSLMVDRTYNDTANVHRGLFSHVFTGHVNTTQSLWKQNRPAGLKSARVSLQVAVGDFATAIITFVSTVKAIETSSTCLHSTHSDSRPWVQCGWAQEELFLYTRLLQHANHQHNVNNCVVRFHAFGSERRLFSP